MHIFGIGKKTHLFSQKPFEGARLRFRYSVQGKHPFQLDPSRTDKTISGLSIGACPRPLCHPMTYIPTADNACTDPMEIRPEVTISVG